MSGDFLIKRRSKYPPGFILQRIDTIMVELETDGFLGFVLSERQVVGGVAISTITEGSPAARAHLQPEDIIIKVNGISLDGSGWCRRNRNEDSDSDSEIEKVVKIIKREKQQNALLKLEVVRGKAL